MNTNIERVKSIKAGYSCAPIKTFSNDPLGLFGVVAE